MNKETEINQITEEIDYLYGTIKQCQGAVWDCPNVKHVIIEDNTWNPQKNGYKKATPFCSKCGRCGQARNPDKMDTPLNLINIERGSVETMKLKAKKTKEKVSNEIQGYVKKRNELYDQIQTEQNKQWWKHYNEYLKSDAWKQKRSLIIERDKVCQACLKAPIEEVHHKTYDHVFNEPLFDLVGVCKACHDNITEQDRAKKNANQ